MFFSFDKFGIGIAHFGAQGFDKFVKEGGVDTQLFAVAQGATNDPAQDIAPALIAGRYAVDDQECAGANMICDLESFLINSQFSFTCDVGCKIDGKTVGIVELEDDIARNLLTLEFRDR